MQRIPVLSNELFVLRDKSTRTCTCNTARFPQVTACLLAQAHEKNNRTGWLRNQAVSGNRAGRIVRSATVSSKLNSGKWPHPDGVAKKVVETLRGWGALESTSPRGVSSESTGKSGSGASSVDKPMAVAGAGLSVARPDVTASDETTQRRGSAVENDKGSATVRGGGINGMGMLSSDEVSNTTPSTCRLGPPSGVVEEQRHLFSPGTPVLQSVDGVADTDGSGGGHEDSKTVQNTMVDNEDRGHHLMRDAIGSPATQEGGDHGTGQAEVGQGSGSTRANSPSGMTPPAGEFSLRVDEILVEVR